MLESVGLIQDIDILVEEINLKPNKNKERLKDIEIEEVKFEDTPEN